MNLMILKRRENYTGKKSKSLPTIGVRSADNSSKFYGTPVFVGSIGLIELHMTDAEKTVLPI